MRRRLMVWTKLAAFFIATLPIPGSVAEAKDTATSLSVPIAGTVDGIANTLSGNFSITRFARSGDQLVAVVTLSATVSDATGNVLRTIVTPLAVPVSASAVTAESGSGNLVGNLLCAIAGLLNPGGPLTGLVAALNQLLDALSNL